MGAFGIDVSSLQGNVEWPEVKRAGVGFAMLRAGFGSGSIDVQFRRNAQECARNGIPFGAYWLSYACAPEMAREEARQCLEIMEDYQVAYPVCIAFGQDSVRYVRSRGVTVTRELATRIVEAFCGRVEEAGCSAMYYSGLDFLERMFDGRLREKYALWFAGDAGRAGDGDIAMWQYSRRGKVSGIDGDAGLDLAFCGEAGTGGEAIGSTI